MSTHKTSRETRKKFCKFSIWERQAGEQTLERFYSFVNALKERNASDVKEPPRASEASGRENNFPGDFLGCHLTRCDNQVEDEKRADSL